MYSSTDTCTYYRLQIRARERKPVGAYSYFLYKYKKSNTQLLDCLIAKLDFSLKSSCSNKLIWAYLIDVGRDLVEFGQRLLAEAQVRDHCLDIGKQAFKYPWRQWPAIKRRLLIRLKDVSPTHLVSCLLVFALEYWVYKSNSMMMIRFELLQFSTNHLRPLAPERISKGVIKA